jgi:phage/plasmid-associated DNA primase
MMLGYMGKIFKFQSALRITLKTFVDLEGVISAVIRFCKPDGKKGEFAATVSDTASGILNWLLEGIANWKQGGLKTPKAVLFATDEYRREMDVIGNFIKEKCIQKKEMSIAIKKLYKAYSDWYEENNEHPVSERFFTLRLKEMGFEQDRTSTERFWVGVGLQMSNEK